MGKIKEAFMQHEEVNHYLKTEFSLEGESKFDMLNFCYDKNLTPSQARDFLTILISEQIAKEIWEGNYENFDTEEFIIFNIKAYDLVIDKYFLD